MLQSLLRAIVFAMREAGQLNRAAHVAGIRRGRGELIDAHVPALNQRCGDQRHSAADHVHGNHVETFARVGRKLTEIGAQQIGKRRGSVDAFIPSAKGKSRGSFDNRGPHNRDRQPGAACNEHGFGHAFRQRVGIWPAQPLRATHSDARQPIANPALAVSAQHDYPLRRPEIWTDRCGVQAPAGEAPPSFPAPSARASTLRMVSSRDFHSCSALKSATPAGV